MFQTTNQLQSVRFGGLMCWCLCCRDVFFHGQLTHRRYCVSRSAKALLFGSCHSDWNTHPPNHLPPSPPQNRTCVWAQCAWIDGQLQVLNIKVVRKCIFILRIHQWKWKIEDFEPSRVPLICSTTTQTHTSSYHIHPNHAKAHDSQAQYHAGLLPTPQI